MTTVISGAPYRPLASTSQPSFARTAWRAAASPIALPSPAPVGRPTLASRGRPRSSSIQAPAVSSVAAAAGESAWTTAFWPQAVVSQSAAAEAGSCSADHEPEVAGADACDDAGIGRGGELLDHGDRVHRSFGKLRGKPLADGRRIGARPHVAVREAGQVVESDLRGTPQGALSIVHRSGLLELERPQLAERLRHDDRVVAGLEPEVGGRVRRCSSRRG